METRTEIRNSLSFEFSYFRAVARKCRSTPYGTCVVWEGMDQGWAELGFETMEGIPRKRKKSDGSRGNRERRNFSGCSGILGALRRCFFLEFPRNLSRLPRDSGIPEEFRNFETRYHDGIDHGRAELSSAERIPRNSAELFRRSGCHNLGVNSVTVNPLKFPEFLENF